MSENNNNSINQTAQAKTTPLRIRSRFPKAQPNINLTSGINRIRRLSGHYNENEKPDEVVSSEKTETTQNRTPIITRRNKLATADLNESTPQPQQQQQQQQICESTNIVENEKSVHLENEIISESPVTITDSNEKTAIITELCVDDQKKLINNENNVGDSSSSSSSTTIITEQQQQQPLSSTSLQQMSLLNALQQNNYCPRFTKEHIMNIIKFKAMQKLKKIESDNLKEKRKSYKPNFDTENIDRSKLRMRDFLYCNPKNRTKKSSNDNLLSTIDENSNSRLENVERLSISSSTSTIASVLSTTTAQNRTKSPEVVNYNAPQLKFAEDGSIILNEESLVIQRPQVEAVFDKKIIENDPSDNLTYNSYRKFHHTKKWSNKETAKFYKALSMIGTDFTMIQRLFPLRNRDEIKRKFKREEKINQALIDKILTKTVPMDLSVFVDGNSDSDDEEEENTKNNQINSRKIECDENTNDTSTKSTENDENNDKKSIKKKPYDRYKPNRIRKRAFIESDDDNTEGPTKDLETNSVKNKIKTKKVSHEIMSQHIIDTINSVINRMNMNTIHHSFDDNEAEVAENVLETNIKNNIEDTSPSTDTDTSSINNNNTSLVDNYYFVNQNTDNKTLILNIDEVTNKQEQDVHHQEQQQQQATNEFIEQKQLQYYTENQQQQQQVQQEQGQQQSTKEFIEQKQSQNDTENHHQQQQQADQNSSFINTEIKLNDLILENDVKQLNETVNEGNNNNDENENDIEVLIDLDNDYCEIIDTSNQNKITDSILAQEILPTISLPITNDIIIQNEPYFIDNQIDNNQNEEQIVILDLDSNQTIIKNRKTQLNLPNVPTTSTTTPTTTPKPTKLPAPKVPERSTTSIKSSASLIASSADTFLTPLTSFSKLIFVKSNNNDTANNNEQFQVHMVTQQQPPPPQPQQQQQENRFSNSEIIITKQTKPSTSKQTKNSSTTKNNKKNAHLLRN